MNTSINRRAARAVAMYAGGAPQERRELLEAIGVVAPGGREVLPDVKMFLDESALIADFNPLNFDDTPSASARAMDLSSTILAKQAGPCKGSTAPPGLWNPPDGARSPSRPTPAGPKPRGARPQCQKQPIKHGTEQGYRAHFRHGEEMCDPCRQANRAYSRAGYERRLAAKKAS